MHVTVPWEGLGERAQWQVNRVLIKEFNKVSATRNECRGNGQNMDFRWVYQREREDLALNSDSVKWKHVWPGPFSGHVHSRIKVRAHTHRCAGGKDRLISWRKKGGNNNVEMYCLRFSQIIAFYLKRWNIHLISAYYMLISLTDNKTKYRDTALKASERMKFRLHWKGFLKKNSHHFLSLFLPVCSPSPLSRCVSEAVLILSSYPLL